MLRSTFLAGASALATTAAPLQPMQTFVQQSNIGVNVPLSGDYATMGQSIVRGVQAAIDETNRYTSSLTHAWGLRSYDDRNTVAVAQSNVFVAASDPSIIGMVGNLTADITLKTLPQYANASFAIVVPCSTADAITAQNFRNVYRLPTKDSSEGQLFAKYALRKRSGKTVICTVDGDFGIDTASAFLAQAKADKHDVEMLTFPEHPDPADSAAIVLEHAPSYVYFSGRPEKLAPVADALRVQGYQGEFGLSDGFYTSATVTTYVKPLMNALTCSSFPPIDRIPAMITNLTDFRNEVGPIDAFCAFGYAAAQLLIAAQQRSNATTRFALLNQLQSGGTYDLMTGQYSFNFTGDATIPNIYIFRVTDKGFTFVESAVPDGYVV